MDTGGLAQMSSSNVNSANGLGQQPTSGLASRRGGQNLKPLSLASPSAGSQDNGVPTPRTSRSHLLAGLRTAPKTATASTFSNSQSSMASPTQQSFGSNRNSVAGNMYGQGQNMYNPPKTAMPQYVQQQPQQQQPQQQQQQQQQQHGYGQQVNSHVGNNNGGNNNNNNSQQYTMDQILAPPEIRVEDQEQMDPQVYAQLVATNMYLAQQQRALQQELLNIQAAAQQFQGLNLGPAQQQIQHQQLLMYQQQQQVQTMQNSMLGAMGQQQQAQQQAQPQLFAYMDPMTGQTKYYLDSSPLQQQQQQQQQTNGQYFDQALLEQLYGNQQQQAQYQNNSTPRVQVSPPAEHSASPFRTHSPPKRNESPGDVTPLPPPSANAFRRGHKKIASLAMPNAKQSATAAGEAPLSAGPRTSSFPMTPATGSYGPGQGRAGEHPVRQPRGPPSIEELKAKPTTKHEGSKNFGARTRRCAVHNLVRAGKERRKGTSSSSGSMSPVSETAEESTTPITDNESDSGRSGSGSLSGDMDCSLPSSRASVNGSWGAIGSDRPSSRQKGRKSIESLSSATSACDSEKEKDSSFASIFKNTAQKAGVEVSDGQRKASMMVLKGTEKRRASPVAMS